MSKALSVDLRIRVMAAIKAGASQRKAAARFGVSAASVSRWRSLVCLQGDTRPGPLGGDRRSGRIKAQAVLIKQLIDEVPDATVEALRRGLAERGHPFGQARCSASSRVTGSRVKKRLRTQPNKTAPTS